MSVGVRPGCDQAPIGGPSVCTKERGRQARTVALRSSIDRLAVQPLPFPLKKIYTLCSVRTSINPSPLCDYV